MYIVQYVRVYSSPSISNISDMSHCHNCGVNLIYRQAMRVTQPQNCSIPCTTQYLFCNNVQCTYSFIQALSMHAVASVYHGLMNYICRVKGTSATPPPFVFGFRDVWPTPETLSAVMGTIAVFRTIVLHCGRLAKHP